MKIFHGTSTKHLDRILKKGLTPRGKKHGNWKHTVLSHPDAVYLTNAYALYYSLQACSKKEPGVIFEVDTAKLNPFRLHPDEDFLAQATHKQPQFNGMDLIAVTQHYRDHLEDYQENWEASVKWMGNCCHMGGIAPGAITRYAIIPEIYSWVQWSDPTIGIMNFRFMGDYYKALTASLFDPVEFEDPTGFRKMPPPEKLATIKVHTNE